MIFKIVVSMSLTVMKWKYRRKYGREFYIVCDVTRVCWGLLVCFIRETSSLVSYTTTTDEFCSMVGSAIVRAGFFDLLAGVALEIVALANSINGGYANGAIWFSQYLEKSLRQGMQAM